MQVMIIIVASICVSQNVWIPRESPWQSVKPINHRVRRPVPKPTSSSGCSWLIAYPSSVQWPCDLELVDVQGSGCVGNIDKSCIPHFLDECIRSCRQPRIGNWMNNVACRDFVHYHHHESNIIRPRIWNPAPPSCFLCQARVRKCFPLRAPEKES